MTSFLQIEKTCEFCNETFIAKTIQTRYCSHTCNQKGYKQQKRREKIANANVVQTWSEQTIKPMVKDHKSCNEPQPAYDYTVLNQKQFLTLKEAAVLLNITALTLRRWILAGLVKSNKVGKKHVISREIIDGLVK